jgi:pimeloyl-ACP methyl ester carboxylesterase
MRACSIQVRGGTLETGWWGPAPADAPTLVLLHEGLGSVGLWRDVPERLAAATGWGVFAYSRFGYGNSDGVKLPRPMTYMQDEALVVLPEVLREAGIQRAVLIGHSDGGSIAAIYAGSVAVSSCPDAGDLDCGCEEKEPADQHALTVMAGRVPAIFAPADEAQPIRPDNSQPTAYPDVHGSEPGQDREGLKHQPALLGVVTIAAHFIVEDWNIANIRRIKADYETGALRQRLARHHRDVDTAFRGWNDAWLDPRFQDFDITAFLPRINVPILALQGTHDPYGTDEQLRILEANVQAPITTQMIAGARHSPHLEATDATLAAITSFIANLPRGPST